MQTINTGDKHKTHVINFADQAKVQAIVAGKVFTTIRRGQPVQAGDRLLLVQHKDTPNCRRLRSTHAHKVTRIHVCVTGIILHNTVLLPGQANDIAVRDGFEDFKAMLDFFRTHVHLPIEGQLIEWL